MRRGGIVWIAALSLAACAPKPKPVPTPVPPRTSPPAQPAPQAERPRSPPPRRSAPPSEPERGSAPRPGGPGELPGWAEEDHLAAFAAFHTGCGVSRDPAGASLCRRARELADPDQASARLFLEENFRVEPVGETGLLTAYFSPEYEARDRREGAFTAPVRPTPLDLEVGRTYADRATIERRPAANALAWMRPEDLFFLQIQGSGALTFPDGRQMKAVFAAHNSRPFVGIAIPMRDRGLLPANNTSGDAIRAWLAENAGPRAEEIMRLNPRYVFFNLIPDDGLDPAGAAGIPLPAGHAIAVDPSFHSYGSFYWIDASAPNLAGAFPVYRRAVMALDTGGAIRGEVRADLYLGRGAEAGIEAGRVRHMLRMYRLIPRED